MKLNIAIIMIEGSWETLITGDINASTYDHNVISYHRFLWQPFPGLEL